MRESKKEPTSCRSEEELYSFGLAHYKSGNWKQAADVFRVLCTNHPLEANFWFLLGSTLQRAGNYQEALYSWALVALLSKDDPYPHFHAAECCLSLQMTGDATKALLESEKRIQQDPHPLKGKIALLKEQWRL